MNIPDSMKLAKAKFKARKVRSILSALAAGFMLIILITSSLFTNGIIEGVQDRSFGTDEYLAYYTFLDQAYEEPAGVVDTYYIQGAEVSIESIDGVAAYSYDNFDDFYSSFATLEGLSEEIFSAYVSEDIAPQDGVVDIVVSNSFIIAKENLRFASNVPAADKVNAIREAQGKYLNQTVEVAYTNYAYEGTVPPEPETFEARVVGFSPGGSSLFESYAGTFVRQTDAGGILDEKGVFAQTENNSRRPVYSFEDSAHRDDFVLENCPTEFGCEYYNDPVASIRQFTLEFKSFINYVAIFLAFMVASSMFVTVSKIIGDSERETGVFRAIGARRIDIAQIYLNYATLIAVTAFILAFTLSMGLALYFTSKYGASFAYQIADFTGNFQETSNVVLIGFNLGELFKVFMIGFVAAALGVLIPILRLVRKDPIKAMRSD